MSPYRHVLCPVDFSDISKTALQWSLELSRQFGAELTVLHVIDTSVIGSESLFAVPDSAEEQRVRAEEKLHELKREMSLEKAQVETIEGVPFEAIALAAKDRKADLLIMGTHGWSGVQRLLLGSVAEKVLHRTDVPLLTVSPRAKEGARFETILVAVDFGEDARAAIRHALWLAEKHEARLVAAHIVPVPYIVLSDRTLERLSPSEYAKIEENLSAERRSRIAELLPESAGVKVEIVTKVGNVFDLLRQIVAEKGADLVVMGAGGHSRSDVRWLGSTCHKMVRLAPCPVLIAR